MRLVVLLAGFAILVALTAFVPGTDARPAVVCTNGNGGTCPGIACADTNLNGKFDSNECVVIICPEYGCCTFDCPPPPYY